MAGPPASNFLHWNKDRASVARNSAARHPCAGGPHATDFDARARPAARPWHTAVDTGRAAAPAPLRWLQSAFPPGWIHRDTAQALLDAAQVFKLGPGPLALSPRDHPPAWWLVADGRIVAGDTGAQGGLVESRLVEAGKSGSTRSAAGPWPTTSRLCANDKAYNRVTDFE